MKEKVKETVEQFLNDVSPYGRTEDFIQFVEETKFFNWMIYTNTHVYSISASYDKTPIEENYLGCIAQTRKPRPGEDHTRGNDLPDGKLTVDTWDSIKNAIIKYELAKLSPARKYMEDVEEKPKCSLCGK